MYLSSLAAGLIRVLHYGGQSLDSPQPSIGVRLCRPASSGEAGEQTCGGIPNPAALF